MNAYGILGKRASKMMRWSSIHSTMASWRYRCDETKRALKAMTWMKTERWIGMNSPCT